MVTGSDVRKILVIGASSGIGLACCKLFLERNLSVRAFSRSAAGMSLADEKLDKQNGNALERTDVERALDGCDAVVQALGVPLSPHTVLNGTTLFSEATAVLLPAMQKARVRRLVSVTGFGAGSSKDAIPVWQQPAFKAVLERIYRDKGIQERQIKESDTDWTIVRPTVLTNGRRSGKYKVFTDPAEFRMGRISRRDVADFVVGSLEAGTFIREAPVVTR